MEPGAPQVEKIRVLLVRGNGKGRAMSGMLREEDFVVVWVEMLAEALSVLQSKAFRPHAIVLDTELPDSDGIATAISVMRYAGDVPVIVISDDDVLEQNALRKGVATCIPRSVVGAESVVRAIHGCVGDYTPVPVDLNLKVNRSDSEVEHMVSRVRAVMEG